MENAKKSKNELLIQIEELQKENASLKAIINSATSDTFSIQTKLILENACEGIFSLNPKGEHTFVNPMAGRLLGYTPDELIGKHSHSIWHHTKPDGSDYPSIECPIYASLHDGIKHFGEESFIKKDGSFIPVEFSSIPIIENEIITGAVVSFRGITKRKIVEKSLQESEERFRLLYSNSKDAIMVLTPEEGFTAGNTAAIQMFACLDEKDFTSRSPGELSPEFQPDGKSSGIKAMEMMSLAIEKGSNFFEWTHRRTNGMEFPATVLLSRFEFDGKPILQATVRDITSRKEAENILRDREVTLRGITEAAQDAIIMMNPNGEVSFWNPAAERIFGFTKEDALGRNLLNLIIPERYFELHSKGNNAFQHSGKGNAIGQTVELQAVRKDGKEIEVELSLSALQIDQKWNAVGIIRDITQRKLTDKELTATIAEKDKFFSIIAHDLKSPFAGFLGLTQIMAEQMQDLSMKELQQYSRSLKESASNLYKLLENLLEWSRIQRGLISFNPENISLIMMVEQNIEIITERAKQKEIEIQSAVPDETTVLGDVQMLNTVLRNLISNSLKFTNHGGNVLISSESIENHFVQISIKDSGIGMDKETLGKLFHVDEKISRPGTDGESSTGLGLLLCKEFVEKNGGRIWVESEEEKGSTFHFTIPTTQL